MHSSLRRCGLYSLVPGFQILDILDIFCLLSESLWQSLIEQWETGKCGKTAARERRKRRESEGQRCFSSSRFSSYQSNMHYWHECIERNHQSYKIKERFSLKCLCALERISESTDKRHSPYYVDTYSLQSWLLSMWCKDGTFFWSGVNEHIGFWLVLVWRRKP